MRTDLVNMLTWRRAHEEGDEGSILTTLAGKAVISQVKCNEEKTCIPLRCLTAKDSLVTLPAVFEII